MFSQAFPDMCVNGMRGTRGQNGITPSVYASWLQKSIRRGLFDQAVYAAGGLYSFASQEKGAPLLTFLLNRLEIIALEDVGLANPHLVDCIMVTLGPIRIAKRPLGLDSFSVIAGVVKVLCESPKTRLCSWLKNILWRDEVPFDLGPYGALIKPILNMQPGDIKKRHLGFDASPLSNWCWTSGKSIKPEWYYGIILLLIRPKKYKLSLIDPFESEGLFIKWAGGHPEVLEGHMRDIVLDIHTGAKKRGDTGARYDFAIHGAHVENEAVLDPCHVALKEYYNECKRTGADLGQRKTGSPELIASLKSLIAIASSLAV